MQDSGYAGVPPGASAIPLHSRQGVIGYALVDEADYDLVSRHRWYVKHDYPATSTYPYGKGRPVTIYMHRLILGLERGDKAKVDHRNHDSLDNRRENIRICSHAENHQNRRRYGDRATSSQYRGVSWRKAAQKWAAYACVKGEQYHLGFFDDEHEAGRIAADFRRQHMPFSEEAA